MNNTPYIEHAHINIEQEMRLIDEYGEHIIEKKWISLPGYIMQVAKSKPELLKLLDTWFLKIHPEFNKDQFELATYGNNDFESTKDIILTTYSSLAEILWERGECIDLCALPPRGPAIWYTDYKPYYPLLADTVIAYTWDPESLRKFDITSSQFSIDDPDLMLYRAIAEDLHNNGFENKKYDTLRSSKRAEVFTDIVDTVTKTGMISWGIYPPSWDKETLCNDQILEYFIHWPNTQHLLEMKNSSTNEVWHYLEIKPFDLWVECFDQISSQNGEELITKRYNAIYTYIKNTYKEYLRAQ